MLEISGRSYDRVFYMHRLTTFGTEIVHIGWLWGTAWYVTNNIRFGQDSNFPTAVKYGRLVYVLPHCFCTIFYSNSFRFGRTAFENRIFHWNLFWKRPHIKLFQSILKTYFVPQILTS